jgi:ABC-type uncharacterized transport system substrate-binding protein
MINHAQLPVRHAGHRTAFIPMYFLMQVLGLNLSHAAETAEPGGVRTTAAAVEANADAVTKKRVLYIDSYDAGFEWVQGITEGLLDGLNIQSDMQGVLDQSKSPVQLKIFHMDTKRNSSLESIQAAAIDAKALISSWRPDIVIASDDNASKYLIAPYYKDSEIPFVFCGINWDASEYGFPFSNVTGMIEVNLVPDLIKILRINARGDRIGVLTIDRFSQRKDTEFMAQFFNLEVKSEYVRTFEEWKAAYVRMQQDVDMLIVGVVPDVEGWDDQEAETFVREHARIPSGSWDRWMLPVALVGVVKSPQEQGRWAARTALEILNGKSPSSIPITTNTEAKVYLNMTLAREMGVKFPFDLIERSTLYHFQP